MRKLTKAIIAVLCIVICMSVFFACDNDGFHQYTELKSDGEYHWYECPDDGAVKPDSREAHKDADSDGKCDVCGYAMEIPHTHNYSELKSNSEHHWYECACGDKKPDSKVKHADEDRNGECDICHKAVTVIDIKGVSFAIAGKDGKTDVELNGVEVTIVDISDKNNSFKATIADGQFTIGEDTLIPVGEYTVSADGYNSTTINITKDGIDCAVVVLNKIHTVANSVKIEEKDGVPTLIVEGMIPAEIEGVKIGNVMLHYDAEYTAAGEDAKTKHHFYVANTSDYAGVYHFELALSELPVSAEQTWSWFHIYPYTEENPTAESMPITTDNRTDLARGDILKVGASIQYNKVEYGIRAWHEGQDDQGTGLAISTDKIPDTTITVKGIKLDETKGALVLSGEYTGKPAAIAIHTNTSAQGSDDRHYYGNVLSPKDGKFEVEIDLTQITYADTPWCWFHLYIYNEQVPESDKLANYDSKVDLKLNGLIETGKYIDYDGVRYTIAANNYDSLVIAPTDAPTINKMESVEIKLIDEKPVLVVKGYASKDAACVKIHVDGNGDFYGEGVAAKAEELVTLQFDLSQLNTVDKTYYFHIWTYADAEPADNSNKIAIQDVPKNDYETVQIGKYFDYNGLRYTIQDNNWNGIPMSVTNIPTAKIESVSFDTSNGKAELVVKGTKDAGIGDIKIAVNANNNARYYGNNVSDEEGKFECRFDFAGVVNDQIYETPWCWFYIFTYNDANPSEDKIAEPDNFFTLPRGDFKVNSEVVVNDIHYVVQNQDGLVIQPKPIPTINYIKIETIEDVPTLVVKGTTVAQCVKLHIWSSKGEKCWENKAEEEGKLEFRVPVTDLPTDCECWFHTWTYATKNAEDSADHIEVDLGRGDLIEVPQSVVYNGIRYWVRAEGVNQFCIQAVTIGDCDISSVKVDTSQDGKPILVVEGTTKNDVTCVKIHADGNGEHWYGEGKAVKANEKFTLEFDLTQLTTNGTPWCWFHLYIYSDAEGTNKLSHIDLSRWYSFASGESWTHNGVKYTVISQGQICIQPTEAE